MRKTSRQKIYEAYYYLWLTNWRNGEYHDARKPWRTRRIGCLRQCWLYPIKPGNWMRYPVIGRKDWKDMALW